MFHEQMNAIQHKKRLHDFNLLKEKKADELRNKSLRTSQEVIITFIQQLFIMNIDFD